MKALWLCSWYPGKTEPFNGDFVQRHARAAALFMDVQVIHVMEDASGKIKEQTQEVRRETNLTEHIIYINRPATWWGRLVSNYNIQRRYQQAIKKYIKEKGKPDIVHVHVTMKAGIAGLWLKRRYGLPFTLTEHWGIYNTAVADNYTKRNNAFKLFTKRIVEQAAGFISVSRFIAEGINQLVTTKEYIVIPNTVNTELFHYSTNPHTAFRFIHVSNMVPLKNAEGILAVFKKLKETTRNVELYMVGDTHPGIRNYAASLGLTDAGVFFYGEVPYPEVAAKMQQCDCFILFSDIENSPCVIGEALCCGLPVIATAVGGIPELVHSNNSLLITPCSEDELVKAMQNMVEKKEQFDRKKIAEDAQCIFSYPVIGQQFIDYYKKVIQADTKN
ncbi:MAG TPA: glycosyltransferase [Chitinophagaceae bacterium]